MNGFVKFVRQNSSFLVLVLTPLLLSPMVIVVDEQYPKYSKVSLLLFFFNQEFLICPRFENELGQLLQHVVQLELKYLYLLNIIPVFSKAGAASAAGSDKVETFIQPLASLIQLAVTYSIKIFQCNCKPFHSSCISLHYCPFVFQLNI